MLFDFLTLIRLFMLANGCFRSSVARTNPTVQNTPSFFLNLEIDSKDKGQKTPPTYPSF